MKFERVHKTSLRKALEAEGWVQVELTDYWKRRGATAERRWSKGFEFRSMRNAAKKAGLVR